MTTHRYSRTANKSARAAAARLRGVNSEDTRRVTTFTWNSDALRPVFNAQEGLEDHFNKVLDDALCYWMKAFPKSSSEL